MSSTPIDDGGPAFPQIKSTLTAFDDEGVPLGSGITGFQCGMTLRDWFAGKAMAAMALTYMEIDTHRRGLDIPWVTDLAEQVDAAIEASDCEPMYHMAECAYHMADAMIEARKSGGVA